MLTKAIARSMLGSIFSVIIALAHAQSRAICVYSEAFQGGSVPSDWIGLPAQVERLDGDGNGTGAFTAPWQVGNAAQANAAGYFPVPDEPQGNAFVMANDDAAPCDCAMDDVSLFSPFYDLSGTIAPSVSYRVYHDGRPFNGQARVDASTNGVDWETIDDIPEVLGAWQQRVVDLGGFSSGSVQLRFRYDDGGNWASGIAVDDVCVFARLQDDIALTGAWLGDVTESVFNTSSRSLGYSRMPLEQQEPLRLSARIRNNGLAMATAVRVDASITTDAGTQVYTSTVCETLDPLQDTLVSWDTGFLAGGAGTVTIALVAAAFNPDEETSDNAAALAYTVTSTAEGNNTLALDNDLASTACGTDSGFSAGCRYEMLGNTSTVHGISVRFAEGTTTGSRVHALLMDASFNLLSSSASHTVTEEDLGLSFSGGSVYLPLDSTVTINEPQDVIALVRCLPDSGSLRVACGGAVPQGSVFVIDAQSFLITYPGTAPIVRIHLMDAVTGLSDDHTGYPTGLSLSPNPAHDRTTVRLPATALAPVLLEVIDAHGRRIHVQAVASGTSAIALDTGGWLTGMYLVRIAGPGFAHSARMIVD